ncbi:hypothetical protein L1887_22014 [Cichorium endivia]|nr:hypothetical protein L1887_22014 [Cichorium endivia]
MHTPSQRIANVRIVGLPLEFRSISNIKEIADHFGLVLEIDEDIWGRSNLSTCKATILTKYMIKINEEINISFGIDKFKIGLTEDDIRWNPFDKVSDYSTHDQDSYGDHCQEDSEADNEDDGISDTRMSNHDHMYEEGEIPPDDDGRDRGTEESKAALGSLVAPPVAEGSIINDANDDCQSQSKSERIEESGMSNDQNNNNNFVFNAVNNKKSPTTDATGDGRDPNMQFNGLLSNRSFRPFPMRSNTGGKRVLPKSLLRRPNMVSNEWIINHSLDCQTNKRSRAESVCSPSQEASIDLNKYITYSNNSLENVASKDLVPGPARVEVSTVGVMNEQQLIAKIGNMLGINVDADNEILVDVMGEGANNDIE